MLADTTFVIDLAVEASRGILGPAGRFLSMNRSARVWTTVISLGELAAGLESNADARRFLTRFRIARLHPEVAYEAAEIDRELIRRGDRLGDNDNWIAGFARYYGEPIISNDQAFDRVGGVRRVAY